MQKYIQKVRTLPVALPLSLALAINTNVAPHNEQSEKLVAPADPQHVRPVRPVVHGFHSAVDVSLPGFPTPLRHTHHLFHAGDRRASIQSGYEQWRCPRHRRIHTVQSSP
jgi:hypothetical protein